MPKRSASRPLSGAVAVVAGATRGAGRGIAIALGEQGATVICTGRSTRHKRSPMKRPETIEETAELVTAAGGKGIFRRVDHTDAKQVAALFRQVQRTHKRLDVLVNDVWGGDPMIEWGKPFWETDLDQGFALMRQAVHSHLITAQLAAPLMIRRKRGLIVEITDGDTLGFRGTVFYDLVKTSVIRLAWIMAEELRSRGVAVVAVTPGFLRSEMMLEHFGVTEANWRDAGKKDKHFLQSESPRFVGRAVAALAADRQIRRRTGQVLSSWDLARAYKLKDVDGRRPDWGAYCRGGGIPPSHPVLKALARSAAWLEEIAARSRSYLGPTG